VGGLLPEQAKRLPAELAQVDAYLDEERFIAPWRALFDRRLGRPAARRRCARGAARAPAALGEEAHRRAGWCAGQAALLAAARGVLAEHSHEPRTNPGEPIPAA
jgi:hypothetical protein